MIVADKTGESADADVSSIAACIAEPARTRMLFSLMDGHARTSTELAVVGGVSPSTASVHLGRLKSSQLVKVAVQGKHHYYSLASRQVARALEGLSVVAGCTPSKFVPNTPSRLRAARTCYDHIAGTIGVRLHDRFLALKWLAPSDAAYKVTAAGTKGFAGIGIDLDAVHSLRRRFAYPCLDWSERQPHIAGALGAAILQLVVKKRWMAQDPDSRVLVLTNSGRHALSERLGLAL